MEEGEVFRKCTKLKEALKSVLDDAQKKFVIIDPLCDHINVRYLAENQTRTQQRAVKLIKFEMENDKFDLVEDSKYPTIDGEECCLTYKYNALKVLKVQSSKGLIRRVMPYLFVCGVFMLAFLIYKIKSSLH